MITVPKFKKASQAATWIADTINKDNWIQGALAKDIDLKYVPPKNKKAVKFCALGWIQKANQKFDKKLVATLTDVLNKGLDEESEICIEDWNDNNGCVVADVRKAFRNTTKLLAKEEAVKPKKKA